MKLDFKSERDRLYVKIHGEIDLSVAADLRQDLDQNLDKKQARHLILDFTEVSFIDSSGLGVILGRYKRLTEIGGTVQICGVNDQIEKILELSGFGRIMKISPQGSKKSHGTSF
ncbi:anti-sigma F factor antagonist [Dehalobacterium formicoaceticum]|uniref:Anti-sigma F factor antagonist n=1 Tax=Dehalobacterium formicoaceticum TaxID=51515 RepID=A0ABT1Y5J3_9FIRM|nr:anti-sigma F factor antagonist [Dehalobacterium formicoaceticum]MCR6545828.1 anti-sigma F factor antagonist [Dehalobacterium formicoaceticum]